MGQPTKSQRRTMFEDETEQDMCGALIEMRAIYKRKGELKGMREAELEGRRKLALRLVRRKMEKCGMTACEAAEYLGLDSELADWCVRAMSVGEGVGT